MFRDTETFATTAACAASPDPFAADPRAATLRAAAKQAALLNIATDARWLSFAESPHWSEEALATNAARDLLRFPSIVWG